MPIAPVTANEWYASIREERYAGLLALAWELGRQPLQREAADKLGISRSYASSLTGDPDGSKERVRKEQYAGECDNCGGRTNGYAGPGKAAVRCRTCISGEAGVRLPAVHASRPIWNEEKCLDSLVRWVERHNTIPRTVDLTNAELGERPCFGTIMRYCYRYERHEESLGFKQWMNNGKGGIYIRRWSVITKNLPDIMVELAPRLPASAIINASNAWVRMRLFEVVGIENLVKQAGLLVSEDEYGKLWRVEGESWPQPVVMVECVNSTPEPDGSHKTYFLRVHPDCATPKSGLAWTFDMEEDEYVMAVQT